MMREQPIPLNYRCILRALPKINIGKMSSDRPDQSNQTFAKLHPYSLIINGFNSPFQKVASLLVPPKHFIKRGFGNFVGVTRRTHNSHHKTNMKRKRVIKTWKVPLRI